MSGETLTPREALRKARVSWDPVLASKVEDLLRIKYGVDYEGCIRIYKRANDLDERTASEEWEELMQEAEHLGL